MAKITWRLPPNFTLTCMTMDRMVQAMARLASRVDESKVRMGEEATAQCLRWCATTPYRIVDCLNACEYRTAQGLEPHPMMNERTP